MTKAQEHKQYLDTFYVSFRAIRIIVIILSAILAYAVVELISYIDPTHPYTIALSWILVMGLGIVVSELVIIWAKRHGKHLIKIADGLAKTGERYRRLINSISDLVILVDTEGSIEHYNQQFGELLGYSSDELDGMMFIDIVHPDDKTSIEQLLADCISNELSHSVRDIRGVCKDGSELFLEARAQSYADVQGKTAGVEIILHNLTKHRAMEECLKESEIRWQKFVDRTSDGIVVVKDSQIIFANQALENILGRKKEEIIGTPIIDYLPLGSRDMVADYYRRRVSGEDAPSIYEAKLINNKGASIPVEINAAIVEIAGEKLVFAIIRDLTQRKELLLKEQHLKLFFENVNDAIFISDEQGKIVQVNRAAEFMTGFSPSELVEMSIHDLFDIEDRELSLRQHAWMKRGNRVHFESRFITARGHSIDVDISGSLVKYENQSLLINIVRDVTERKRFLAQLTQKQKMESLGVMAGGIAHDFNNVLEGIIGAGELARDEARGNTNLTAYLDVVLRSAERGARLTKHLLSYARQSEVEAEIVDVNAVVEDADEFLMHTLNKRIHLRLELDSELDPITGDSSRLLQAIINLALNSQDAMPDGGEILIRTRNISIDEHFAREHPGLSPGPHIELLIQDTGTGIDPEVLPRVFDPFFTTKGRDSGTGLGLAMVYSTIASHGGIIDLKSRLGEGTEAHIYLPAHGLELEDFGQPEPLEQMDGGEKTVMVVDDEDIIQTVLCGILKQIGYKTIQAHSGKEAIELLDNDNTDVDVILLDMIMPGLSGWETYQRISKFWPQIPVVVITGYADEEHTQAMIADGLAGFIEKPFKAAQIAEKLKDVLSGTG